jgi:hypothetical protein
MKTELEHYLHNTYPSIFPTRPTFQCESGWFFLILWTCRFLDTYKKEYDRINDSEKLNQPEILKIKNDRALLSIKIENSDKKIESFINSIYFISGYICEKTGKFNNNVYDFKNEKVINEMFIDESSNIQYIDNKELRDLIQQHIYNE